MAANDEPPDGGTNEVPAPITAVASEGDELYSIAKEVACPECSENVPIAFIKILAPEGEVTETSETYKDGLGLAAAGGAAGALLGPAGVVGGMALGSLIGGFYGRKQDVKKAMQLECPNCRHKGGAS